MNIWLHFILNDRVTNSPSTHILFLQIPEKQVILT